MNDFLSCCREMVREKLSQIYLCCLMTYNHCLLCVKVFIHLETLVWSNILSCESMRIDSEKYCLTKQYCISIFIVWEPWSTYSFFFFCTWKFWDKKKIEQVSTFSFSFLLCSLIREKTVYFHFSVKRITLKLLSVAFQNVCRRDKERVNDREI